MQPDASAMPYVHTSRRVRDIMALAASMGTDAWTDARGLPPRRNYDNKILYNAHTIGIRLSNCLQPTMHACLM